MNSACQCLIGYPNLANGKISHTQTLSSEERAVQEVWYVSYSTPSRSITLLWGSLVPRPFPYRRGRPGNEATTVVVKTIAVVCRASVNSSASSRAAALVVDEEAQHVWCDGAI